MGVYFCDWAWRDYWRHCSCVMNFRMVVVRMASLLLCLSWRNIAVAPTSFVPVIPSRRIIGDSVNVVVAIMVALFSMGNMMLVLVSIPVPVGIIAAITIMISVTIMVTLPVAVCLRLIRSCFGLHFCSELLRHLCPSGTGEQQ
jgi:hypothetical protein